MTPIPASVVALAQEDTPNDYSLKWSGYKVKIDSLMAQNLQVLHTVLFNSLIISYIILRLVQKSGIQHLLVYRKERLFSLLLKHLLIYIKIVYHKILLQRLIYNVS